MNDKDAKRQQESPRGDAPNPEVLERATRRRFTKSYKIGILRQVSECTEPGSIGALLRREGLYSSHLANWRQQLQEQGSEGLGEKRRGPQPKPKPSAREIELERENRKLEKRLAKAEIIIEFQKKVHDLLGIPLKHHEIDEDDPRAGGLEIYHVLGVLLESLVRALHSRLPD